MEIFKDVKNVVTLIHGVNTRENKNWLLRFKKQFDADFSKDSSWRSEHIYYGYVFFLLSIIPFVRHSKIKEVQTKLRQLQRKYPNAKIHILGHSYGTMLTHQAVKYSDIDTDKEPIKLGKLILVGGIISHYEQFKDTLQEGQIEGVYNFCSHKDWIVRLQPAFGKCGYFGFVKAIGNKEHKFKPYSNLEIYNYRFDLKHSQYFDDDPPDFYVMWSQILRKK